MPIELSWICSCSHLLLSSPSTRIELTLRVLPMVSWLRRSSASIGVIARVLLSSRLGSRVASPSRAFSNIARGYYVDHRRPSRPTTQRVLPMMNRHVFGFTELGTGWRFESTEAEKPVELPEDDMDSDEEMDFPGGKVSFISEMEFIPGNSESRVPCYRVLDQYGQLLNNDYFKQVSKEVAVKIYSNMVTLQMMDVILYEAQRQGRISFYITSMGEEAINIASAAALSHDDVILAQYREPGVLLWRGFTLQEFANQLMGNRFDYGKGRQMPIHYGSNKLNYITISSPLGTQIPQAVGVAYSLKMDNKNACAVTYIGDGATSEGDFHAGLNFAAVTESPVLFICRNNGWAISTHISEQFRSDGVVVKGRAYGIPSIRVDGNDSLAVYTAVKRAREIAIKEQTPILIEAMTYRVGHHSTSDDSTKYRPIDEIEYWKTARNPVSRFRNWVEGNRWWSDEAEAELRANVRDQLLQAIRNAENTEKPPLGELFTDVYDVPPENLQDQEAWLRDNIKRHPKDYPSDVPV